MGQGGVGKTAMTLRYTTGEFNAQVRLCPSDSCACSPPFLGVSCTVVGARDGQKANAFC